MVQTRLEIRAMARHDHKEAEQQVGRAQGKGLGPRKDRNEALYLLPDQPPARSSPGSTCLRNSLEKVTLSALDGAELQELSFV